MSACYPILEMRKLIGTFILAITLFFSTVGGDRYESVHSECHGAGIEQSVARVNPTPTTPSPHEAHPCHIGHCAFLLATHPKFVALTTMTLSDSTPIYTAHVSGFPSETLRPPSHS